MAQRLHGSSIGDALKDQLLKVNDSLNSALQANMKLARDNENLEDRVHVLTIEAKGLEMHAVNVEALVRSQDREISRLQLALAIANKEKEEAIMDKKEEEVTADKERI